MVFRPPSALAAAIRASMLAAPPEASADAPADAGVEAAGADPAAVGAVELPLDEQAANTKLATTRRPAIRVTFLCVDNIRPPVVRMVFPIRRLSGASFPGTSDRLIHRQCGGRR